MTASALVGQILSSRYRIVKLLGEGGMGAVYEAQHVHLDKRVVVKTLHDDLACDKVACKRFRREAWATARIEHANIVRVTDVDVHEERLAYFVMEYLPGEDLAQTLAREGPLAWPRVRKIGMQICSGLVATHAQKVIHRDLKPSNCFRVGTSEDDEQVKILDFGIAKVQDPMPDEPGETVVSSGVWQRLTQGGVVFGTFAYMSPEHVRGDEVDYRTDIYGVGVILYQLLTNRLPIPFDQVNNLLHFAQILVSTVPPPPSATVPDVPEEFDRLIARALAKRKEDRFGSMQELLAALRDLPVPAQRVNLTTTQPRSLLPVPPPNVEEQAPTRVHARTASREAVRSASVWRRCSLAGLSGTIGLLCVGGWLTETGATPLALAEGVDGPFQSPLPTVLPGSIPTVAVDTPVEVPKGHTRPVKVKRTPRRAEPAKAAAVGEPERCDLDPYDRLQLVQLYRKQVARQCKQALVADATIPVKMRIVRGKVEFSARDEQSAQRRAAAECIAQQLEGRVKAPSGFAGCMTAWGTILF